MLKSFTIKLSSGTMILLKIILELRMIMKVVEGELLIILVILVVKLVYNKMSVRSQHLT